MRRLPLPACIAIENAEEVAAELKQLSLAEGSCLILDASKLERLTTPGLQLVISLQKTMQNSGGSLRLENVRESLHATFQLTGLKNLLAEVS